MIQLPPRSQPVAFPQFSADVAAAALPTAERAVNLPIVKILLFYQDFGAMGGIERMLLQMARLLNACDSLSTRFEVIVACCEDTPLYQALQASGVRVAGLPNRPIFSRSILRMFDFASLARLKDILRRERPDVLHAHIGTVENLWLRALAVPLGVAMVYTVHGYGSLYSMEGAVGPLRRLGKQVVRWLFRRTVREMDALLFVSEAERLRMTAEGYIDSPDQGQVLHNGLPTADIAAQAAHTNCAALKASLDIPANARVVSLISRLDANKNPMAFIALAQQLVEEPALADVHYLIAGDGPLLPDIQQAAAGLPRLHVLGHRSDVPALLAISNLMVSTARAEAFGLGLIEAMAAGVPVLPMATGGAREVLAGLLPLAETPEALAFEAKRLLGLPAPERKTLADALRNRAACFDESRFIDGLSAVYVRLTPKVSVILPVYNAAETVRQAIASVQAQTYAHWELIVVDDGSMDDTASVLAGLADDPRVKIIHQANAGVAMARNNGFSHATGEYIAFIDADDAWLPEKVATEVALLRQLAAESAQETLPQCIVYSGYDAVDGQGRLVNRPSVPTEAGDCSQAALAREGLFLPSTCLMHRAVFEAIGGFQPACYHEDRVFFIAACRQFPAFPTGRRLVRYRQTTDGRCRRILKDYEQALVAELSIVETLRPLLPPVQIEALAMRQRINLLCRFLMYGEMVHARRLYAEISADGAGPEIFAGRKGLLASLSLSSGLNLLQTARLTAQGIMKRLPMPPLPEGAPSC